MMMKKINILTSEWSDGNAFPVVRPLLNDINLVHSTTIPISRLYDQWYWSSLSSLNNVHLVNLDFKHWYDTDDVFQEYITKISLIKPPAVCLFDRPYDYERPSQLHIDDFERKLYFRSKLASSILRENGIKVVSPAIAVIPQEFQSRYLNYFVQNRLLFDIYAMHCCYDYREQSTALLSSFLQQVLNVLKKEVWVTKWSVPSCEHPIENRHVIGKSSWIPMSYTESSVKMTHIYDTFNEMCQNDCKWFYTGIGKDDYDPDKKVPLFGEYQYYPSLLTGIVWNQFHFMGLINYKNEIKNHLIQTLQNMNKNVQ